MKKVVETVLVLLLLGGLIFAASKLNNDKSNQTKSKSFSNNTEEAAEINFKGPTFTLKGLDGKQYTNKHLQKPTVINFWASWCGPCKIEAPELVKLYKKYQSKIEIYAVNLTYQDDVVNARAFAEQYGFTFPVLLDDNKVSKQYKIAAIPTTYFLNQQGIIVDRIVGFGGTDVLEQKIKKLASKNKR